MSTTQLTISTLTRAAADVYCLALTSELQIGLIKILLILLSFAFCGEVRAMLLLTKVVVMLIKII